MHYTDLLDTLLIRGQPQKRVRAFTLVEILITMAILGTLSAIAVPTVDNYVKEAKDSSAITDIKKIELEILKFWTERGRPPDTLAEAGLTTQLDPWGRPYQYLRLDGIDKGDLHGGWRKDQSMNPLNADFDLYSMGKDGRSQPALNAQYSHDDIVRANNGAYIGLASEY